MSEHGSIHVIVTGRVQGVGYRAFVQRVAGTLRLQGWVRNCPDGTVESVASGEKGALEAFVEQLRSGAAHARVDGIQVDWAVVNRHTEGFQIIP